MKNLMFGTSLVIAILMLGACKSSHNKFISNEWNKDTCGCSRVRNNKLAEKLLSDYKLMNNTQAEFLKVFGKPDTSYGVGKNDTLIYYWGTVCTNNKVVNGSDKCYADFFFKEDKLVSKSFPCE